MFKENDIVIINYPGYPKAKLRLIRITGIKSALGIEWWQAEVKESFSLGKYHDYKLGSTITIQEKSFLLANLKFKLK